MLGRVSWRSTLFHMANFGERQQTTIMISLSSQVLTSGEPRVANVASPDRHHGASRECTGLSGARSDPITAACQ